MFSISIGKSPSGTLLGGATILTAYVMAPLRGKQLLGAKAPSL